MLVLATTSQPDAMAALGLGPAFGAALQVPSLRVAERATLLRAARAFATDEEARAAAEAPQLPAATPLRRLLQLLELARHHQGGEHDAPLTLQAFLETLEQFGLEPAAAAAAASRD